MLGRIQFKTFAEIIVKRIDVDGFLYEKLGGCPSLYTQSSQELLCFCSQAE
jgi:hypothetical protein